MPSSMHTPGGAAEAARPRAELGAQDGHGAGPLTAGGMCHPLCQLDPPLPGPSRSLPLAEEENATGGLSKIRTQKAELLKLRVCSSECSPSSQGVASGP